jgi:hypothetical protein
LIEYFSLNVFQIFEEKEAERLENDVKNLLLKILQGKITRKPTAESNNVLNIKKCVHFTRRQSFQPPL